MHINWLRNQICVLGCMLRSHARYGNEFQTPRHHLLPEKHWDTLFLNSSKSKTRLKFMKHGMLSWNGTRHAVVFFVSILREGTLEYQPTKAFCKNSSHFNISNVCIIQIVCVLLTLHVSSCVFVLMAIWGAMRTTAWPWLNGRRANEVWCAGWPTGV